RLRRISWQVLWFSRRPITKCRLTIIINGGPTSKARTGVPRWGRKVILKAKRTIPSWKLRTLTRKLTRNGRVNAYRPKPSLNLLRAAVSQERHTYGATNFVPLENGWPTPGREHFRLKIRPKKVTPA